MTLIDVAIVGGGPAGLSAALMLGRCRRTAVLIDAGEQRNRAAREIHGFLTRDGVTPAELLRLARADVARYPTIELREGRVRSVEGTRGAFRVCLADGTWIDARRVLLATGVSDVVPEIAGLRDLYGKSVHHCPHCDAFEYSGKPVAVYGGGPMGTEAALAMLAWTEDVVLVTDGMALGGAERAKCEQHGIGIRDEHVVRLVGTDGRLERIELAAGEPLERVALFLATGQREKSPIAAQLGCEFTPEGTVVVDRHEVTRVPGVYVAGDAANGEQLVIVAAAEGVVAATKINASLAAEDLDG
jgi:thioredoxin reductase